MKTMNTLQICIFSVLLCLLPAGFCRAGSLDSRLPAETLVYLEWSGRSLTFDGSRFGQMILDPEVKDLANFFRTAIQENIREERGRAAFEKLWNCAALAWQHPMAAGIYHIRKEGVSLVFLIDLGDDKPAFEKEFQEIPDLIPPKEKENVRTVQTGQAIYTRLPGPESLEPTFGYLGNIFFFTLGPEQAQALLDRKSEASLSANARYQQRMKVVSGEDVQLAIYVDVESLLAETESLLPKETPTTSPSTAPATEATENSVRRILLALGVDNVQALAGTVRIVEKGMYSRFRLFAPAPHQGLLLPLTGAPLTDADLAGVPADADLAAAINLSPKAAYDELRRVLKDIDPLLEQGLQGAVATLENHWNFSLENDLLANLGDTWVYSVSPSQGGPLVGSMITVEATNPEKLQAFIDNLERTLLPPPPTQTRPASRQPNRQPQARIGTMKVGETEIHYLRSPGKGFGMAFLPAWAVHKNRLYLALWPQVIASAMENSASPLTESPDYQILRKRFSPAASALLYVNTPEIMKKLYPLQLIFGTLLMNAAAEKTTSAEAVPLWPGSLPGVLKYLTPHMSVVSHDAEGITIEGYGTCP